jgi:LPPG:FO 2-phospho-L-lactate transferase
MHEGQVLSQITQTFCQAWGVLHKVIPMSNQPVRTMVDTDKGELAFQEYFVHQNCEPKVKGFRFLGIESAQPAPGILEAIEKSDAVVLCPSNPWVSIDPILALSGFRTILSGKTVLAVSPIIGGRTVKGPAAKMFTDLGIRPSAIAVAHHYADLLSGFVIDSFDSGLATDFLIPITITNTLMNTKDERSRLAKDVLNFIRTYKSSVC